MNEICFFLFSRHTVRGYIWFLLAGLWPPQAPVSQPCQNSISSRVKLLINWLTDWLTGWGWRGSGAVVCSELLAEQQWRWKKWFAIVAAVFPTHPPALNYSSPAHGYYKRLTTGARIICRYISPKWPRESALRPCNPGGRMGLRG